MKQTAHLGDSGKVVFVEAGQAAGLEEIYVQRWLGGLPRFDEGHLATVAKVRSLLDDEPKATGVSVTGAWAGGVGVPAVIADARAVASAAVDKQ